MSKQHILILDQGRQCLPFLKSYKNAGFYVSLVCITRISEGSFSRYPDEKLFWPNYNTDPEGFKSKLLSYLKRKKPLITLALGDVTAEMLSANKNEITKYTRVSVPDYDVFLLAKDKNKTMKYCMDNNIPCPYTIDVDEIDDVNISQLSFPLIVKPKRGVGAIGVKKINNINEFQNYFHANKLKINELLFQEFIPQGGTQYQAEAFLDWDSKMKVCMVIHKPRYFPVTGGTSTANVTVKSEVMEGIAKKLLEGINWVGAADIDFILDPRDNKPKVLEINPRVTAGIKIGFKARVDYADLHYRLAMNKEIPAIKEYTLNIYSRNLVMDLLWYLFSSKEQKKETNPSFYRFIGKNVIYQTWSMDDPFTGFGFLLNMVIKFSDLSKFKEKIGLN